MRRRASGVVVFSAIAIAIALSASVGAGCKKKTKITLRDPATLPHVMRPFPKLASTIAFKDDGIKVGILRCYAEALARDPKSGGTFHVTAMNDVARGPFPVITIAWKTAVIDKVGRFCVESGLNDWHGIDVAPGSRAEGDVTFSTEMRSEAVAPGWSAYGKVIERELRGRPLRVVGVKAEQPLAEAVSDDTRTLSGNVVADLEFTEDGLYEMCGDLTDFTNEWHRGPPCPKVKHLKTDRVSLSGYISFTLENDGWKDNDGRHWFGDEPREVEE
jgi:hypothetical protein